MIEGAEKPQVAPRETNGDSEIEFEPGELDRILDELMTKWAGVLERLKASGD